LVTALPPLRSFSRFFFPTRAPQVTQLTAAKEDLEKRLRLKGEELALAQNADAMLREQLKARTRATQKRRRAP
jgi:hypothetical protein